MDAIMDLLFPKKGAFLISCVPVTFSRRASLHGGLYLISYAGKCTSGMKRRKHF